MSRSYSYDSRSRISGISETIAGSTFSTTLAYDSYGRLSSRTHPSGVAETFGYNGNGYLSSVSAGGSPVYTITSMNARQQVTAATLSSSMYATYGFDSFGYPTYSKAVAYGVNKHDYRYSFNPTTGNPAYRRNYLRSLQESFSYDTLGRLTGVSGPRNLTTSYANSNGNILKKAHLADTISYAYGANAGPYAMTSVTAPNGLIPNVNQFVGYTSFEKVDTIFEAPYKARFLYNSENQRARMVVSRNDTTKLTRWYAGSRYMKETSGTTTKEYTYLGGDAYSAPVVAVTEGGTTSYYYLLRDYLGNVTHMVNSSYGISGEYSYDAWGRRRSADDWSYTLDANDGELMAGRGFTGHEHLPWCNLINMNGRLYDPVVGRFLSPDPYVQSPDFTQNFNRYSYCLNNPLKYTDPEGNFYWIIITGVVDFISTALFKGGLDFTSKSAMQNAWRDFDPTAPWSITNKAWKIDMGLFKTDPNKSFLGRLWELRSRFTWQILQTALGYAGTGIHNLLGGVRSVDYYGGSTVVESYSENWGAITLGSYINGSRGITADPNDRLFQHEYGHYIQSQTSGFFYLSKYGIPSALSKNGTDHSLHPAEQDANIRAFRYFNKHIEGYSGWVHTGINSNPINGYDPNLPFNDSANQLALKDGRLRLSWYDFLFRSRIVLHGLLNTLILNNRY